MMVQKNINAAGAAELLTQLENLGPEFPPPRITELKRDGLNGKTPLTLHPAMWGNSTDYGRSGATTDEGVDLLALTRRGEYWAIQAKQNFVAAICP
jgi:hypothetical protein